MLFIYLCINEWFCYTDPSVKDIKTFMKVHLENAFGETPNMYKIFQAFNNLQADIHLRQSCPYSKVSVTYNVPIPTDLLIYICYERIPLDVHQCLHSLSITKPEGHPDYYPQHIDTILFCLFSICLKVLNQYRRWLHHTKYLNALYNLFRYTHFLEPV